MAVKALQDAEIKDALKTLDGWQRDGDALVKHFKFDSYLDGIAFASAVGVLSEARDHHPDLSIGWRKVTVSYSTHDAGDKISQKDIDTAQAVDSLAYPKAK